MNVARFKHSQGILSLEKTLPISNRSVPTPTTHPEFQVPNHIKQIFQLQTMSHKVLKWHNAHNYTSAYCTIYKKNLHKHSKFHKMFIKLNF